MERILRRKDKDSIVNAQVSLPFFQRLKEVLDEIVGHFVRENIARDLLNQWKETIFRSEDIAMTSMPQKSVELRQKSLLIIDGRPAIIERIQAEKKTIPDRWAEFGVGFIDRIEDKLNDFRFVFAHDIRDDVDQRVETTVEGTLNLARSSASMTRETRVKKDPLLEST